MSTRCKVTFYDVEHGMYRSVEVQASSPMAAAVAGLRWMLHSDRYLTDFADGVRVEIITTTEHSFSLQFVAQRLDPASAINTQNKVA